MPVTDSEAYLESLARKSFLSMWSYTNPGYGLTNSGKGGKELCDLLVMFANNVILFSDKKCRYPDQLAPIMRWRRWYKRSIEASINQLIGAKKTLLRFPERICTDSNLTTNFPLKLTNDDFKNVFLVAVTHDSGNACLQQHRRESLKLDTRVEGSEELLTVGCRFKNQFIHILDDKTLELLFGQLDTISDFVGYLERKEAALSEYQFLIHGEENLLALYMKSRNRLGNHIVPTPSDTDSRELTLIEDGEWQSYVYSDGYLRSQTENRISYNIDNVIEHFTDAYFEGQMAENQAKSVEYHSRSAHRELNIFEFSSRVYFG